MADSNDPEGAAPRPAMAPMPDLPTALALLDHARVAIALCDGQARIAWCNPSLLGAVGRAARDTLG